MSSPAPRRTVPTGPAGRSRAGNAGRQQTTATPRRRGRTLVAVDRNEHALRDLPDDIRREVTTDPAAATRLIDPIASEAPWPGGPRRGPGRAALSGLARAVLGQEAICVLAPP